MPIYMDIHEVPGIEAMDAAQAHQKDMLIQHEYHCKCMTYWIDEPRGVVFCLIEAPDKSVVEEMHKNSHGLIPHKIIEVKNDLVENFLGRIHDPEGVVITDEGFKVFSDSAFRILLITDTTDPVLLRHGMGKDIASELLQRMNSGIRQALAKHEGREVESFAKGFIVSFSSVVNAMGCALDIYKKLPASDREAAGFKMAINAGEPVSKSDKLFGDTITLGHRLCSVRSDGRIIMASSVKELIGSHHLDADQENMFSLSPQDENLMNALLDKLEDKWKEPGFTVTQFCKEMAMSNSQLYRKTMALWGLSPNQLLNEFRLEKARELLKSNSKNISETTFDAGFTSPSYFTKCFKKKFGLLPASYLNALS